MKINELTCHLPYYDFQKFLASAAAVQIFLVMVLINLLQKRKQKIFKEYLQGGQIEVGSQ